MKDSVTNIFLDGASGLQIVLHSPTRQRPGTQAGLALGKILLIQMVPTKQGMVTVTYYGKFDMVDLKILEKAVTFQVPFVQLFKTRIPLFLKHSWSFFRDDFRERDKPWGVDIIHQNQKQCHPGMQSRCRAERLKLGQVPMISRKSLNFSWIKWYFIWYLGMVQFSIISFIFKGFLGDWRDEGGARNGAFRLFHVQDSNKAQTSSHSSWVDV